MDFRYSILEMISQPEQKTELKLQHGELLKYPFIILVAVAVKHSFFFFGGGEGNLIELFITDITNVWLFVLAPLLHYNEIEMHDDTENLLP